MVTTGSPPEHELPLYRALTEQIDQPRAVFLCLRRQCTKLFCKKLLIHRLRLSGTIYEFIQRQMIEPCQSEHRFYTHTAGSPFDVRIIFFHDADFGGDILPCPSQTLSVLFQPFSNDNPVVGLPFCRLYFHALSNAVRHILPSFFYRQPTPSVPYSASADSIPDISLRFSRRIRAQGTQACSPPQRGFFLHRYR